MASILESDIQTLMQAASAAAGAADYDLSLSKMAEALILRAALPVSSRGGNTEVVWTTEGIEKAMDRVRGLNNASKAGSVGIQRTKITYVRATD